MYYILLKSCLVAFWVAYFEIMIMEVLKMAFFEIPLYNKNKKICI
jgi:hypothetical protein